MPTIAYASSGLSKIWGRWLAHSRHMEKVVTKKKWLNKKSSAEG